jgi:hypothetical protein
MAVLVALAVPEEMVVTLVERHLMARLDRQEVWAVTLVL